MPSSLLGRTCPTCGHTLHPVLVAPAVATQKATDGDSNGLMRQPVNGTAVGIRRQAEPADGYRDGRLVWICPLCGVTRS